jgi:uncharacterized protein YjiS (DUF1127 family)
MRLIEYLKNYWLMVKRIVNELDELKDNAL